MKNSCKFKLVAFVLAMVTGNIANAQKQKPIWDSVKGFKCECGTYIVKRNFYEWRGENNKYKVDIVGPCPSPSCGKCWFIISANNKDEWFEPVPDERSINTKKRHELGKECISVKESMIGNIKSIEIVNQCPHNKTVYVYLRGKKNNSVFYIISKGQSWIKNIDMTEYDSIKVTHNNNDIPNMTPEGN